MAAPSRTIEMTILSAQDLRIDNKPVKKNSYVVVSANPFNRLTTQLNETGGSFPSWNQKLVLDLPATARFVAFEVRCKTFSGDRTVGSVSVPVSDFVGGYAPENFLQFLSYRLRDGKGCRNGIIDFSVKVRGPLESAARASQAVVGVPAKGIGKGSGGGVAIGVPVWRQTVYPPPYHYSNSSFA